jgi:hypothetical protein
MGEVLMATLTIEIKVVEWFYTEGNTTHIRLELGNNIFLSFEILDKVIVPKQLVFQASLETKNA